MAKLIFQGLSIVMATGMSIQHRTLLLNTQLDRNTGMPMLCPNMAENGRAFYIEVSFILRFYSIQLMFTKMTIETLAAMTQSTTLKVIKLY